jgi:hypothetical protein
MYNNVVYHMCSMSDWWDLPEPSLVYRVYCMCHTGEVYPSLVSCTPCIVFVRLVRSTRAHSGRVPRVLYLSDWWDLPWPQYRHVPRLLSLSDWWLLCLAPVIVVVLYCRSLFYCHWIPTPVDDGDACWRCWSFSASYAHFYITWHTNYE